VHLESWSLNLLLAIRPWKSEEANKEFYRLAEQFFGPPIGDSNNREKYHRRYPPGVPYTPNCPTLGAARPCENLATLWKSVIIANVSSRKS